MIRWVAEVFRDDRRAFREPCPGDQPDRGKATSQSRPARHVSLLLQWLLVLVASASSCHRAVAVDPPPVWTVPTALRQPAEWFLTAEGRSVLGHVLTNQSAAGSWPKNVNTAGALLAGPRTDLRGTFDNGATTGELRLLARAFSATTNAAYRDAFLHGLGAILESQYPTGGWPQFHPAPAQSYHRLITYNDGAMQRLLELLQDVLREPHYAFVPVETRRQIGTAFERGLDCIVKSQIRVRGRLTVWCAQHDPVTLEPRGARTFELVSLSGAESAGLLGFLMRLDRPSPDIIRAVHAGARWFAESEMRGVREARVNGDKRIEPDPTAPPLWARFYEIDSNRPLYCGRDGAKKFDFAGIEPERRNGYAWHGSWGESVARRYADWAKKFPETGQEC